MTKNKILFLLTIFAGWLSMSSCYKDLGNYTYHEINSAEIGGIDTAYSVMQGEVLQITPELKFSVDQSGDTSAYAYAWYTTSSGEIVTLAETRNFNGIFPLATGSHKVYYRVTEKKTGLQWFAVFKLTIETSISQGYLLLCDVNGKARLDMLSYHNIKGSSPQRDSFYFIPDVLAGLQLPAQDSPYQVMYHAYNSTQRRIYILSKTGTNRISEADFHWEPLYDISSDFLSGKPPAGFKADRYEGGQYAEWMVSGGDVYYGTQTAGIKLNLSSLPCNYVAAEKKTVKVSPFFAVDRNNNTTGLNGVFYDMANKRFLTLGKNKGDMSTVKEIAAPYGKFPFNNTGMDLVFMTSDNDVARSNNSRAYAILKPSAGGSKRYLAIFGINGLSQSYFDEIVGPDVDKAEKFTLNPRELGGELFYSVGGKLYEHTFGTGVTKLVKDYGSRQISELKYQFFNSGISPDNVNTYKVWAHQLMVCTYDPAGPAGKNGIMDLFTVPDTDHDKLIPYSSYAGFGKIVSVTYREK